jgi:hypothetical protein
MVEGSGDPGIEAACFLVREQRWLEKAAVSADVSQAGKELRVGAAPGGQFEKTLQSLQAAALIDLKVGIEVVSERKVRS